MRKFIVNVNGTAYEVEVEEIGGAPGRPMPRANAGRAPMRAAPAPRSAPVSRPAASVAAPATPAAPAASAVSGGNVVSTPMTGNIVDIKVKVGDSVKAGDVLLILEAMKMENEITAPSAGTVKELKASKGIAVNTGDVLAIIG